MWFKSVRVLAVLATGLGAVLAGPAWANPAAAQAHAQAMNDIAATPPWNDESNDGGGSGWTMSGIDWAKYAEEEERTTREAHAARLKSDPAYAALHNGAWFYTRGDAVGETPFCSATFVRGTAVITLMEAAGAYDGAFIGFSSLRVPKSDKLTKVALTLDQTGEARQSVQGFNTHLNWVDMGMVMFAVPSIDALLAGMEDVHRFDVAMKGKQVFYGEWHSGLMARNKLRECVAARKKANP